MPWYGGYGLDWNRSTEDIELPRWILSGNADKTTNQRVILQRVKFRGFYILSSIEYHGQCLEAEGHPKEEIEDTSLLIYLLCQEDEQVKVYSVTKAVMRLLELACRRPGSSSGDPEAGPIVADGALEYMPPLGSIYSDVGLHPDMETFRILNMLPRDGDQIQCTLELADSLSQPYDALSYVWRPMSPLKPILVNGVEVEIGVNLHSALDALPGRSDESAYRIWVDALCIDQQNDEEKGFQVAMMAKIYANARRVFIYLGAEDESTAPFFDFLNRDHHLRVSDGDELSDVAESCGIPALDIVKGYIDFAFRPWFSRIWVAQEYGLANWAPIFYCGTNFVNTRSLYRDLDMLDMAVSSFINFGIGDIDRGLDRGRGYHELMSCLDQVRHIIKPERLGVSGACIPSIEYQAMKRTSSDPRDIVYGMREFFEAPFREAFMPDYTIAPEHVFMRLSAWFLVIDNWPNVFECFPKRLSLDLPSWVRDFTQWQQKMSFHISRGFDNCTLRTTCAIHEQVLYAECMELDEISEVYNIDTDDDHEAYRRLWLLDQRFTSKGIAANASVLTTLDTPDKSIGSWAALVPDSAFSLGELLPGWHLHSVLDAVIKTHADEVILMMRESLNLVPPVWDLVKLSQAEVLACLQAWATYTRVLASRFYSLSKLLPVVISSRQSCENLAGAVVFDYANLISQLREVRERIVEKAGLEVSLASLELNDTDSDNSAESAEVSDGWHFKYTGLIEFLDGEDDLVAFDAVLEIIDALRNGTFKGRDVWELPELTPARRLREWSKKLRFVDRVINSVMPSQTKPEILLSEDDQDSRDDVKEDEESRLRKQEKAKLFGNDGSMKTLSRREVAEAYVPRTVAPLKHSTFFLTKGGLPGVGTPGSRDIQKGDKLLWLAEMKFPIALSANLPLTEEAAGKSFADAEELPEAIISSQAQVPRTADCLPPVRSGKPAEQAVPQPESM
ncbi:hypothetical protein DL765_000401 [Monosporascus sp. GIB2]|nr:hypothetical protein DL765_000401 [Monosporascus sp. GIB2]